MWLGLLIVACARAPGQASQVVPQLDLRVYARPGSDTVLFAGVGLRDAWVVSVGVPGAPATVWVDAATRAVLRVRYDISARGMSFTDERVALPERGPG